MLNRTVAWRTGLVLTMLVGVWACSPAPSASPDSSPSEAPASPVPSEPAATTAAVPTTCDEAFEAAATALTDEAGRTIVQVCGSVEAIEQTAADHPDVLGVVDVATWVQERCQQFPDLEPDGICAIGAGGGDIPTTALDGSYSTDVVGVDVSFEVAEPGWVGIPAIPGAGFGLDRAEAAGALFVVPFPGEVFSDPCSPDPVEPLEATAASFIGWIAEHPELDATTPVETTLGGHPALQVDVTSDVGDECPEFPRIWLWVLPEVGDYHLNEDQAARFLATDVGDTTVVVVIETFDIPKQADLLVASEPVLESMTITP